MNGAKYRQYLSQQGFDPRAEVGVIVAQLQHIIARGRAAPPGTAHDGGKTGMVFTSTIGTALDDRSVTREFHAFLKAAKLPRLRVHDLRHSRATMLLAAGEHPKVVRENCGQNCGQNEELW